MKTNKKDNVIRVKLNGELIYMTPAAYEEFRLQLSTGDFHMHTKTVLKKLPKSVPTWRIRDAVYYNPRIAYPTVESIIDGYKSEDQSAEEYAESEDSPLAEFVSSFFYGEISLSQIMEACRFEEETKELIKNHWGSFGPKATCELISSVSELTLGDIYYQNGEILRATIGEQEHQIDDTLAEAFETLTPEEQEQVRRESGAGLCSGRDGRFIYTSNGYSSWILVSDEEKLARRLKKALRSVSARRAVSRE